MSKKYRIAIPVGAAIIVAGVLLGIFLTGGPDPESIESEPVATAAEPTADPSETDETSAETEAAALLAEPEVEPSGTDEPPPSSETVAAEPSTEPSETAEPPVEPETSTALPEPVTEPSGTDEPPLPSETAAAEPAAEPSGTGEPPPATQPMEEPPAATSPVDPGPAAPPADTAAAEQEPARATDSADAVPREPALETAAETPEPMDVAAIDTRDAAPAEPVAPEPADEAQAAQPAPSDQPAATIDEPSRPAPAPETADARDVASEPPAAASDLPPDAVADIATADQAGAGEEPGGTEPEADAAAEGTQSAAAPGDDTAPLTQRAESVERSAAPEPPPAAEPAQAAADGAAEIAAAEEKATAQVTERAPVPPSFDVVRINPEGQAVIAGSAEPGAVVTVRDGTKEIGSVTADQRGEWVLVPHEPLAGGERELSAIETLPNGEQIESGDVVVVSVPDRDDAETEALAVLMPRDGEGSSRVLQQPRQREPDRTGESGTTAESGSESAARTPATGGAPDSGSAAAPDQGIRDQEDGTLVVESVDYGEEGDVVIAGKAEPGAAVNVYVDDQHVGTVETGDEGSWEIEPGDRVEPGTHTLRVDRVDPVGIVLARIETPLVRATLEELSFGDAIVVVQPGNSLWRIARRTLGGGVHFTVIYQANRNQIRDPALIYPGQIFTVPRLN